MQAGSVYADQLTSIDCGPMHVQLVERCRPSESAHVAGDCQVPGKLDIAIKPGSHKQLTAPDLLGPDLRFYQQADVYGNLLPRMLTCGSMENKFYIAVFYSGNKN